jgi:hypothetical protein
MNRDTEAATGTGVWPVARFFDAALTFPAALFTFLLVVAVGYWAVVLLSLADPDPFDASDLDGGTDGGMSEGTGIVSMLSAIGLGGAPVSVVLTVLIAFAWFFSLAGTALLDGVRGPAALRVALWVALLPAALGAAWLGTRSIVVPLRRLLPDRPAPSRLDFVGRQCVVRTGEVGLDFGQAEVAAADGSTAVIQVRLAGTAPDGAGWTGLIYEYDADTETFWITPLDSVS